MAFLGNVPLCITVVAVVVVLLLLHDEPELDPPDEEDPLEVFVELLITLFFSISFLVGRFTKRLFLL